MIQDTKAETVLLLARLDAITKAAEDVDPRTKATIISAVQDIQGIVIGHMSDELAEDVGKAAVFLNRA